LQELLDLLMTWMYESAGHHSITPDRALNMTRQLVVIVLAASAFVSGCASPPLMLPPGEDSQKLVDEIANKGQDEAPKASQSGDLAGPASLSSIASKTLVTSVKVSETCGLVVIYLAYLAASAHGGVGQGGESIGAGTDGKYGLADAFHDIWADQ